jgi:phosphoglycerate dehydrogenase-like enzyme
VTKLTADLYGVRLAPLAEVLAESDYVTIHCSATAETRHLINAETLGAMKPTAHGLANPEVIKTIAVMRATDAGRWRGVPDFSTALAL